MEQLLNENFEDTGARRSEVIIDGVRKFAWEDDYKKSWRVTGSGDESLRAAQLRMEFEQKLQKRADLQEKLSRPVRKGLSRYMFLLLDYSRSALLEDDKKRRMGVMQRGAEKFITTYFDQNPISQLGVFITSNSLAYKMTDLMPNAERNVQVLALPKAQGKPSLQNGLELIRTALSLVPKHGSKEVLVLWNSMSTSDPGDIFETIENVKNDGIQVSVIGFGAEIYVLRCLATATGGTYHMAMDEDHYNNLLASHIPPPPASDVRVAAGLVTMGFPNRKNAPDRLTLCACHCKATSQGYICPRCRSKCCALPSQCPVCGLNLISSPHLARSYHHLFPVLPFKRVKGADVEKELCCGCHGPLNLEVTIPFQCPKCLRLYCLDCDAFIHESLHNCPTCEMSAAPDPPSSSSPSSSPSPDTNGSSSDPPSGSSSAPMQVD